MSLSILMPEDERRINLRVSPELHRRLKVQAAKKGKTLLDLCREWLEEKVEQSEKEQGAE
jgi:predicted HicB family RNase H-like nuclease